MTRPLYKAAVQQRVSRGPDGHAGLWFDKFCDRWGDSWTMSGEQKLKWIGSLTKDKIGASEQIAECASRLRRLVKKRGGRFEVFTTESRFATGLGRSHPVENGFVWHPTLGTPYLPGSSVKGMVKAWAEMDAEPRPDTETRERLLGGEDGKAGSMCFLDAVPIAPVRLEADVMTPHYAGWDEKNPPGDWLSPNPIPFLTTAAGMSFLFGLVPCRGTTKDDLDTVLDWLHSALAWAGAGAKTAIGYGRFHPCKASTPSPQQDPPKPRHTEIRDKPGDRVQAELVEEKTRKGGWKARHLESGLQGPIQDTRNVAADAKPGQQVELTVASVSSREMAFKWAKTN